MPDHYREVYAGKPETKLYNKPTGKKRIVNSILLGTWLGVTDERDDGWLRVKTIGPDGWVHQDDTRTDMGLKLFFIDVGQGDCCLIEAPRKRILVDGGPYRNLKSYLTAWKYKWLLQEGHRVRFDTVIVSHFDADHFAGLNWIIKDSRFEFGAIYHNGIARFHSRKNKRPAKYDTDLGRTDAHGQVGVVRSVLKTSFSTIDDAKRLLSEGGLMKTFQTFLEAVVQAHDEGRLGEMKRLTAHDTDVPGFSTGNELKIKVLGPVPQIVDGTMEYRWFKDSSHTRNGHSVVLRLAYKNRSFLLGGDLNTDSEEFLLAHYQPQNPFRVDVAKACHHGASEFTVEFMEAVKPYATVISSGDNESYSHPRADAIGCAGRYSRGMRPLVFSTELARSYRSADEIHYGLINLRTDGEKVALAQMLEQRKSSDLWDSYTVP
jgi:beta-lactamase superfamily II metal-dependent hydrolase